MARATYTLIDGELVLKAKDGEITPEYSRLVGETKKSNPYVGFGRDTIGEGVEGVFNHADGKRYDSKSQYERAVRAKGCRVVGNDWNNAQYKTPIERGIRGDFNVRPQLKEVVDRMLS